MLRGGPEVERGRADSEEEAAEHAEEDHAVRVVRVQRDRLRPPVRQVHRGGGRAAPRRSLAGEMRGGEIWGVAGGRCDAGDAAVFFGFVFSLFFSRAVLNLCFRIQDQKKIRWRVSVGGKTPSSRCCLPLRPIRY